MKFLFNLSLLVLLFLYSCEKEADVEINFGYDYFPTEVGSWRVYDVDSIYYNDLTGTVDSFQFELKVVVDSKFIDHAGQDSRIIKRYKRDVDSLDWELKDVWTSTLLTSRGEQVEENERFIKLVFPLNENTTWDGNAYNSRSEETYSYSEIDEAATIGMLTFDSTLTVTEADNENKIEKKYATVTYAKDVGPVYKKYIDIETEFNGTIRSGVDVTMTITSYSN